MTKHRSVITVTVFTAGAVIFTFCARVGNPTGGPKDTEPPRVVKAEPPNFSTNFQAKTINIVFDEYIKLNNVNQKLVVSPPLAKRPVIRMRGKGIVIDLNSPLLENTTYTFNFGDAIADNNEGNVLENFLYVFSTGAALDSLETGGKTADAYTLTVPEDVYAALYDDLDDSAALQKKPLYISKADKNGVFALRNLKQDTFRIIGLADANGNFIYDPGIDMIGFLDSLLILDPARFSPVHPPPGDTTVKTKNKQQVAGPEIYLRLFLEEVDDQYLKTTEKQGDNFFHLIFNQPVRGDVVVRLLDDTSRTNWFLRENFVNGDTLGFWFTDTSLIRRKKTDILISYTVSDSAGNPFVVTDTASLLGKREVTGKPGRKKPKQETHKAVKRTVITASAGSQVPLELNQNLILESSTPAESWDTSLIRLIRYRDSLQSAVLFSLKKDTFHLRNYILYASWQPETKYMLTVLPGALTDIYGNKNDTITVSFQTRKTEYYGNLALNLKGVSGPTIIELLDEKEKPVRKTYVVKDTTVSFLFLHPAKYKIKASGDENGNGKWDTGNYLKHVQPEPVNYYSKTLNIRANWDLEENWTIQYKK